MGLVVIWLVVRVRGWYLWPNKAPFIQIVPVFVRGGEQGLGFQHSHAAVVGNGGCLLGD